MSELRNSFAKRLKALRLDRGLTQAQLASRTNLSTSFVSNLERGLNAPSFETLELIAKALDVSARDLFDFRASGTSGEQRR